MNPCPCGHAGAKARPCRCTPDQVMRYQARLSGPLLDRIDLQVGVDALPHAELLDAPTGETSAAVRVRVQAARALALARQGQLNQGLSARTLAEHAALDRATREFLLKAAARLGWSARSTHRVLKVARSIADLAGAPRLQLPHVAEAMQYRRGLENPHSPQ